MNSVAQPSISHSRPPRSPAICGKSPAPASSEALPQLFHHSVTPFIESSTIEDLFVKNNLIGEGGYGRVYTAINKENGEKRALKIMDRKKLSEKAKTMVIHEKEVLRRVSHPSIVKLHRCIMTNAEVCFELDLMRTDLFEFIVDHKKTHGSGGMNEDAVAWVMAQLLSAVAYLHDNNIVHRDIKPENILVNSPADIKLADFGLAKVVEGHAGRNTPMGTSYYIAPEIIRSIEMQSTVPHTTTRDDVKAVDIWACGIVLAFMLSGKPPFIGQIRTQAERRALLNNIDRGVMFHSESWKNVSDFGKDLVACLLERDTSKRITAKVALSHPFFDHFGEKKYARHYAHIPPRISDEIEPIFIGDESVSVRDDFGGTVRAVTLVESHRDHFNTPTLTSSHRPPQPDFDSIESGHRHVAEYKSCADAFGNSQDRDSVSTPAETQSSHPDSSNQSQHSCNAEDSDAMASRVGVVAPPASHNGSFAFMVAKRTKNDKDEEYRNLKIMLDEIHDEMLEDGDSGAESGDFSKNIDQVYSPLSPRPDVRQKKKINLPGQKPRKIS